jgi:hypothetical protein
MALFYRGKHGKRIRNEEHAFCCLCSCPPPPSYYIKASCKGKFLIATQREEREREEREVAVVSALLACAGNKGDGT